MSTSATPRRRRNLAKIGLRAASDRNGLKTYRALNREIAPVPKSTIATAANRVTESMRIDKSK